MKPDNENEFLSSSAQKTKGKETTNIRTIVKVRPMLKAESQEINCIKCSENTMEINGGFYNPMKKRLDRVFEPEATQIDIFNYLSPSVSKLVEGYNVTIFSYGQTGSGKTYTMFGNDWNNMINQNIINKNREKQKDKDKNKTKPKQKQNTFYQNINQDINFAGVIPRCIDHLFNNLLVGKKNVTVYCSFLQLYNQKIIDLLADVNITSKNKSHTNHGFSKQKLIIHENKEDGIYVQGLSEHKVNNSIECLQLMQKGQQNRFVRETSFNLKSSRSHTIFQLLIEQVFPETQTFRRNKINLCDLAGSQKINKKEQVELQHLKEIKNINLSLTTLGKVINTLSSNKPNVATYRESKLTRLLQDSLGGNSITVVIANISSKESCIQETLNTLKFVQRARQVVTEVSIKTYENKPEIKQLQEQVNYLKNILKSKLKQKMNRRNSGYEHSSDQFKQKIHKLEVQNRKLKQEYGIEADKHLISKLLEENQLMKKELQKRNATEESQREKPKERGKTNSNKLSSVDTTIQNYSRYKRPTSEIDSNSNTSHTIDKGHSQSRYTNYSGLAKKFGTVPTDQNIIVKRLEKLEKIKQQNRQKLNRQLKQIQKSEQLILSKFQKPVIVHKGDSVSVYDRLLKK